MVWNPQQIDRTVSVHDTSTFPARAVTDAGNALIKTASSPEGPHALVREWLGTAMAAWLGLPTFDLAIMHHTGEPSIERTDRGWRAEHGPVIAIRWVLGGRTWDGTPEGLEEVDNIRVVAGLVVLDTWIRNPDRYWERGGEVRNNVRNVFLSDEGARPGKYRMIAMDHTACLKDGQMISERIAHIDSVKDPDLYGMFPAFLPHVTPDAVGPFATRLASIRAQDVAGFLRQVHPAWQVTREVRKAVEAFIIDRAGFVSESIVRRVGDLQKQRSLPMNLSST